MIKVLKNNDWVEGVPVEGEAYRKYDSGGGFIQSVWVEPTLKNKIVITSHSKRAVLVKGTDLTVTVEIRDGNGSLIPVTDSFAMPIGRLGGTNYRTLLMEFVDGVCEKTSTWLDAGEFEVTPDMINIHLPPEQQLEFSGFNISVVE